MIAKTIKQIVNQLNTYLNNIPGLGNNMVSMEHLNSSSQINDQDIKIAVNLINIEEDKVYKNHLTPHINMQGATTTHPDGGTYAMRINMYLLFAFNPGTSSGQYEAALTRLTHVLRYFQGKQHQRISLPILNSDPIEFDLEICYHNISLEDSNNMWSNLGGQQKPYAMYQVKLLDIHPDIEVIPVPAIQEPKLSNPKLDGDGNTIFKTTYPQSPKQDQNNINHTNNN